MPGGVSWHADGPAGRRGRRGRAPWDQLVVFRQRRRIRRRLRRRRRLGRSELEFEFESAEWLREAGSIAVNLAAIVFLPVVADVLGGTYEATVRRL